MQKYLRSQVLYCLLALTLVGLFQSLSSPAGAEEAAPGATREESMARPGLPADCLEVLALLKERDAAMTRELRAIKREIAALGQAVREPGIEDAVAGIGYILGLFGIAAFMASRRNSRNPEK